MAKSTNLYAAIAKVNREKFVKKLKEHGLDHGYVYLKGGTTITMKWSSYEYPFRQEKNFYYLTGVNCPDYHLLIDIKNEYSRLIMPKFSDSYSIWVGPTPTRDSLKEELDMDVISIANCLELLKSEAAPIYIFQDEDKDILGAKDLENVVTKRLLLWAVRKCRHIKSESELHLIRKSGVVSGSAHLKLMKSLGGYSIATEGRLQALFEYECAVNGSPYQAYKPIVASGTNASYLHYKENNDDFSDSPGKMLLIDAGGEYNQYASDITRSYPSNGVFSEDAKVIYNIVLKMQEEVLNSLKPGVEWKYLQKVATDAAAEGLIEIGLIKGDKDDKNVTKIAEYLFCHGIGHNVGLDVHDPTELPDTPPNEEGPIIKPKDVPRLILANNVVTVEPGLYFSEYALGKIYGDGTLSKYVDPELMKKYSEAAPGIRIEDTVIVYADSIEIISGFVPKKVEDIERVFSPNM